MMFGMGVAGPADVARFRWRFRVDFDAGGLSRDI